ncbi:MAG TPA: hypothetical protein ENK32_08735 [Anaerolineae bacterium]|nr:hypothetical protein [Anaerolineae bacterium]
MAKIVITKDNLLTSAEFKTLLEQMTTRSSNLEDVLGLLRELIVYEDKYGMPSDVFYARFMRGEMGDDLSYIMWAGQYESYLEARQEIEELLNPRSLLI